MKAISKKNTGPDGSLKLDLPSEVMDVIWYIQDEFQKPTWLLGLRGLYSLGVPFFRAPEEINLYSPITKAERSNLDDYLRGKYKKLVGRRSDHGVAYSFPHDGLLNLARVDSYIEKYYDSSNQGREENRVEIAKGTFVQVPRIEDLIIMKLILGRTKDLRDVRHILATWRSQLNMNLLQTRAKESGVELKLRRLQRVAA